MIDGRGITLSIGGRGILDGVDCRVEPGRVTVLIGPNGAGKSTLLRVLAGELPPDRGHVRLDGEPLSRFGPRALARRRAVVSQSVQLAFPFSVGEVVALGLPAEGGAAAGRTIVARALEAVGMAGFAGRDCTTLSGGEQQRVHFARALTQLWAQASSDGHLLLDEPTASLDLAHQLLILRLARRHAEDGGGVLAVLHDLNLAALVADRVVALSHGRVVASGSPAEVITDALLRDVYQVPLRVNVAPAGVFVLPHG